MRKISIERGGSAIVLPHPTNPLLELDSSGLWRMGLRFRHQMDSHLPMLQQMEWLVQQSELDNLNWSMLLLSWLQSNMTTCNVYISRELVIIVLLHGVEGRIQMSKHKYITNLLLIKKLKLTTLATRTTPSIMFELSYCFQGSKPLQFWLVVANPIHQWKTLHPSFIHKCVGVNIKYCKTLSPHILDQLGLGFFYKLESTFNFTCLEFHTYIKLCNNVFKFKM